MGSCGTWAARIGVVFLVILNILALLLGVGLIVVGVLLKNRVEEEEEIADFLDKIELGSFTFWDLVLAVFIAVICIGAFAALTALIGGCGALCRVRCLLITYIIILVLCILIELTILGFWIYLLKTVNDWLMDKFNDLLEKYNGPLGTDVYSAGWNVIFIVFNCCGVKPVTASYNDFEKLPSEWWSKPTRRHDAIPSSCCNDVTVGTYLKHNNTACTQGLQDYNTSGCYDVFDDTFSMLARSAIIVISIIVLVEVVAIVFSCIVTCAEFSKKKMGMVV